MENVILDTEKLKALAKQFNHQKICSVWGEVASLASLAWEEVWHGSPALHAPRHGSALPELNPASYRETLHMLCCRDKAQNKNQEEQGGEVMAAELEVGKVQAALPLPVAALTARAGHKLTY